MLGAPVVSEPEVQPPFYGCRWQTDTLSSVSVDVFSWPDAATAESSFAYYFGDVTKVEGIGDDALYNELLDLAFIYGSYEVSIDVSGDLGSEDNRTKAQTLAPLVISRLP